MTQVDIDSLSLHPDANRVPMASKEDLAALRASLAEFGQQDPIDITADKVILDGRTRWTLLREQGAQSIAVRVVDIPETDQRNYIVHRAIDRRHLTNDQKRALNELLRALVIERRVDDTGEEMRIGLSRPQRAAKLGVSVPTVKEWDVADVDKSIPIEDAPTHIRREGGNQTPYPIHPKSRAPKDDEPIRAEGRSRRANVPRPRRPAPAWQRHFTTWCRGVLPEDRKYLLAMSSELHQALTLLDLTCEVGGQDE